MTHSGTITPITPSGTSVANSFVNPWCEYTTLAEFKSHKMPDSTATADDELLLKFIRDVSQKINDLSGFLYYPEIATQYRDAIQDVTGNQLRLGRRLLAATMVTNGDSVVVAPTAYATEPRNNTPYHTLTLKGSSGLAWNYSQDPENAISVLGVWGYHTRYADAWENLTTLGASLTNSATAATFAAALGNKGDLLKIGTEFAYLSNRVSASATLVRGVNGSTAAAHDSGATVYRWRVENGIEAIAREAAVLKLIMRDDPTAITVTYDGQVIAIPKDVDAYIKKRLGV